MVFNGLITLLTVGFFFSKYKNISVSFDDYLGKEPRLNKSEAVKSQVIVQLMLKLLRRVIEAPHGKRLILPM